MEYILNDIICEMQHYDRLNDRLSQFYRMSKYYHAMKKQTHSKSEKGNSNHALLKILLDKEIDLEKRIYGELICNDFCQEVN